MEDTTSPVDTSAFEGLPPVPSTRIHLSDVEFRGEVIYFIVLDRFCDGYPNNPTGRPDLNDPEHLDWNKYWGGDLQGVLDKLDYLQELGVTAIWLTPLFEQVEALEHGRRRAPIHGYWTKDFKRINSRWVNQTTSVRLFTKNDTIFDRLIAELHRRKMKFILDIVCNHSSPQTDEGKGRLYDDGRLVADFNDDKDHWYHHYGTVKNWQDEWQIQNCELEGLATFNENNLSYRRYIADSIKLWLDKGVDAIRIDTVKHMPIWFWQEFTSEIQSHKPDVFIFGEWIHNHPLDPTSVTFANQAGMSVLDFGFNQSIRSCLGRLEPAGFQIVQGLLNEDHRYRGATELVTFFENHDMPRLQTLRGENEYLHLALVLLITSRGIPCLYYGCEQYLHNDTDGGEDPYNRPMMEKWETTTEAFRIIKILSRARALSTAIQWGGQWPKVVEPDVYVYLRRYHESRCLVILNRGNQKEMELSDSELPDGKHTCLLSGQEITVEGGKFQIKVGEKQAFVFSICGKPATGPTVIHVQVNGAPTQPGDRLAIVGDVAELGGWSIDQAVYLECVNSKTWFGEVVFAENTGQSIAYKYVIVSARNEQIPHREMRTTRRRSIGKQGVYKWRDIWEE